MDDREPLGIQASRGDGVAQSREVTIHDVLGHDPLDASTIPRMDDLRGQVQDDRDRRQIGVAGSPHQDAAGVRGHVGRVHHGEPAAREASREFLVQTPEREAGCPLVGGVAGEHPAVGIGGQDLVGLEVRGGERGLPGSGGPDEHDHRRVRDLDAAHAEMMRPTLGPVRMIG